MSDRCSWAGDDPLMIAYHDCEWGVPCHEDGRLFEMLILEGAQAGLSWNTILNKREGYREAFEGFDAVRMAGYGKRKIGALLKNPGIVRNRLKVEAAVGNARAFLALVEDQGSFSDYLWQFVGGRPIINRWSVPAEIPGATPESENMSRALRKHGFRFVGPTICYAFMQSVGMVNDHTRGCFRYPELGGARTPEKRTRTG